MSGIRGTQRAEVVWEGDSLEVIRDFPEDIRQDLGAELRRLQMGERPLNSRPMKSIGSGVFELKEQDNKAWYRVIYLKRIRDRLYVLHCFRKKSAKTSSKDLEVAKSRLKAVQQRIKEQKR